TARGPMAQVVSNLSSAPSSDVRAIAVYMADVLGTPTPDRKRQGEAALAQAKSGAAPAPQADAVGASIYAAACASCHEGGRPPPYGGINLGLSTTDRKSTRLNSSHVKISYAVFCLKKKKKKKQINYIQK